MKRFYTRSDPRGMFPYLLGAAVLEHNRLAHFWRPLIDLGRSETTALRLRMVEPLARSLAAGDGRWPEYSMIGVPGLRHQVLRHAGLPGYDCRDPRQLSEPLHSEAWRTLLRCIADFATLEYPVKAQVIFQLAQLSYVHLAIQLAGDLTPDGDSEHDRLAYDVARLHARVPGGIPRALEIFGSLAEHTHPGIALAARFQGIGHSLRNGADISTAQRFTDSADLSDLDDWRGTLIRSRYFRALSLLRLRQGDGVAARDAMSAAFKLDAELAADPIDPLVASENTRYLLELRIQAVGEGEAELVALDPYCVEARLTAGDAYADRGDIAAGAQWYASAGELGTGSGAVGWFRAAQCYDKLGDAGSAVNAMGRCLDLDHTAVEPRAYLDRFGLLGGSAMPSRGTQG